MTTAARTVYRFRRLAGIREERLDEVLFLIHETAGSIHSLPPIGAGVWAVLAEPVTERDIVAVLSEAFPTISRNRIAGDVRALLDDLLDGELIAAVDACEMGLSQ